MIQHISIRLHSQSNQTKSQLTIPTEHHIIMLQLGSRRQEGHNHKDDGFKILNRVAGLTGVSVHLRVMVTVWWWRFWWCWQCEVGDGDGDGDGDGAHDGAMVVMVTKIAGDRLSSLDLRVDLVGNKGGTRWEIKKCNRLLFVSEWPTCPYV